MARTNLKYSPEQKENFVMHCLANGGNVEGTAKELGIPPSTAKKIWAVHPHAKKILSVQKQKFAQNSWKVIFKILRVFRRSLLNLPSDQIRAYTGLLQTLYEKQSHALLEPNQRSLSVTHTFSEQSQKIVDDFSKSHSSPSNPKCTKVLEIKQQQKQEI